MTKVKKNCRICGKEYTPCSYCENDKMAFHYRTICCSRACALIYMARVMEARGEKINNSLCVQQAQSEIDSRLNENKNNHQTDGDVSIVRNTIEKPKRKYTKKKQTESESENIGQIDMSEGTSD